MNDASYKILTDADFSNNSIYNVKNIVGPNYSGLSKDILIQTADETVDSKKPGNVLIRPGFIENDSGIVHIWTGNDETKGFFIREDSAFDFYGTGQFNLDLGGGSGTTINIDRSKIDISSGNITEEYRGTREEKVHGTTSITTNGLTHSNNSGNIAVNNVGNITINNTKGTSGTQVIDIDSDIFSIQVPAQDNETPKFKLEANSTEARLDIYELHVQTDAHYRGFDVYWDEEINSLVFEHVE